MAETIHMPKLGFDMAEGTLVRWVKKEGETIRKGEILAEIETDKATVEVESGASGTVRKHLVDEGAIVPVNTPIAIVGSADEPIEVEPTEAAPKQKTEGKEKPVAEPSKPTTKQAEGKRGKIIASPLARKVAQEKGLDLGRIEGTGPGGRIVRRDVEAAMQATATGKPAPEPLKTPRPAREPVGGTIALSKLRQAIGRRMTEAKTTIPHFYVTHEYRVDDLLEIRRQLNGTLAEDEKVSINDFILKGCALALRQFPNLNASLAGSELQLHGDLNMGVAVAVEGGLLTVVCKQADSKPLKQIAMEVRDMAKRVREGKVRPEDIEGSTFSISNLGMFDVDNFAAIINPPEAAILAVGSAKQTAVVEDGALRVGWTMKVTLSVDHRASDGAEAAKFLQTLGNYLEAPVRLLLE